MIYGTCQGPWGKSVQEKLQVLTIASSRVDMSQHWTTFNFFVRYKNQIFFYFFYMAQEAQNIVLYLEDTEQLQCYVILSSDFSKKLSERKKTHNKEDTKHAATQQEKSIFCLYQQAYYPPL